MKPVMTSDAVASCVLGMPRPGHLLPGCLQQLTKKSESQLSSLKVLAECNSLNQLPTAAAAAAAAAAAVCLIMSHCFGYLYCAVCDIRGCSADRNMMAQAAMMQESMQ